MGLIASEEKEIDSHAGIGLFREFSDRCLLHGFGVFQGRIAELQLGDWGRGPFDVDFLHVAFAIRICDDRNGLTGLCTPPRRVSNSFTALNGPSSTAAPLRGESTVEERKFSADGVRERRRIGEPRILSK